MKNIFADIFILILMLGVFVGIIFLSHPLEMELYRRVQIDSSKIILDIDGEQIETTIDDIRKYAIDNDNVIIVNDLK